jgi:hypothetical protein
MEGRHAGIPGRRGDTAPRDHDGAGGQHYLNRTGRNDLIGFKVAHDALNIKDHELHLSIPRSALAVPDHPDGMIVDFKWVDNTEHPGDIMDFYVSGDVAPVGRFRYRYTGEPVTPRPR